MFIELFSGYVYEQRWWPSVFAIENVIQATIREDWRELAVLPDDELIVALRDRIEEFSDAPGDSFRRLDVALVDDFLHREAPRIAMLLTDLQTDNRNEVATLDPRFALKEDRFRQCMKESLEFRNSIRVPPTSE